MSLQQDMSADDGSTLLAQGDVEMATADSMADTATVTYSSGNFPAELDVSCQYLRDSVISLESAVP